MSNMEELKKLAKEAVKVLRNEVYLKEEKYNIEHFEAILCGMFSTIVDLAEEDKKDTCLTKEKIDECVKVACIIDHLDYKEAIKPVEKRNKN